MVAVEKMEFKVVEGTEDEHSPVYADRYSNKHKACNEDLFDYLRVQVLGRVSDLFGLTEETTDLQDIGPIFHILIADAEKKLERVFELLEENVGRLTIHSLSKGYPWYDDALPLAVFLKPNGKPDTKPPVVKLAGKKKGNGKEVQTHA